MKKIFTLIAACSFAALGAFAESSATEEILETAVAAEVLAPEAIPAPAAAVEVPTPIKEHLALRFPGRNVKDIEMQGVTYYVNIGDGDHVRYDADFNPICYGDHSHECKHECMH